MLIPAPHNDYSTLSEPDQQIYSARSSSIVEGTANYIGKPTDSTLYTGGNNGPQGVAGGPGVEDPLRVWETLDTDPLRMWGALDVEDPFDMWGALGLGQPDNLGDGGAVSDQAETRV